MIRKAESFRVAGLAARDHYAPTSRSKDNKYTIERAIRRLETMLPEVGDRMDLTDVFIQPCVRKKFGRPAAMKDKRFVIHKKHQSVSFGATIDSSDVVERVA